MVPIKAHVRNGHLVLDEPTPLPEGATFVVIPTDNEDVFAIGEADAEELDARASSPADTDEPAEELFRRLRIPPR